VSLPLPAKKYATIYMDPPWRTLTYSGHSLPQRAKGQHYPTMTEDELKALPVGDLADKDCCLFMWIMSTHIDQGIRVAESWGFKFNTDIFVWRKVQVGLWRQVEAGKLPPEVLEADDATKIGMGKWNRKEVEQCFLFTKGKPSPVHGGKSGIRQIINAPIREHSRKPDETYERIEQIAHGPFIELFSRTTAPGWDVWGNETGKFDAKARKPELEALL